MSEDLAAATLALVDIASVSRDEVAILAHVQAVLAPHAHLRLVDDGDAVRLYLPASRRADASLVVLAGHVDTVPIGGGRYPAQREGDAIVGRGTADMKGALAVMLALAADPPASDLDLGFLFFGREELPITESALVPLFERCPELRETTLAIVMEPTANAIEVGCNGNLNALVTIRGTAAHTARPWLGDNAIHAAIEALASVADLPVRDVEVGGLTYREVVSVTSLHGGIAQNVVPDLATAHVNFRYAPSRTPDEAETRLRDLLGHHRVELRILGNAPPGPAITTNPLVVRLRDAGSLDIGPKQAWTPVAEFGLAGIDAVNFGPGDPRYAHADDERIEVGALGRSRDLLRAFLAAKE